jgi:hypothetical protein
MNLDLLKIGDICISAQGRDKGRTYAVVSIIDDSFVSVCDGLARKTEKPKIKRVKHLKSAHKSLPAGLIGAILNGTINDNELHKFLLESIRIQIR